MFYLTRINGERSHRLHLLCPFVSYIRSFEISDTQKLVPTV